MTNDPIIIKWPVFPDDKLVVKPLINYNMTKKLTLLLLLTGTLLSCQTNAVNQNEKKNQELIKTYFNLFNKHKWKEMADLYSEVAEVKDPSLGQALVKQGREQIAKHYSDLQQTFPNLKDEIVNIYPSGDKHMIVEFISSGKAADGTQFSLPICVIFTIENGKIVKDFSYYDNFQ